MKRIFAFTIIFVITLCMFNFDTVNAKTDTDDDAPEVSSESVIVMDAKTGQVLYEKNAHKKMYPASITKIMTALLAIEKGDINSKITISEEAVWGIERDSSHIALDVDEQITLEDALYAIMLVSANEAAWGVAEHIGVSLKSFTNMMNIKAAALGCENTNFVNANGLHDDNHYTTAYDMALITKEALRYDYFMEIAAETYHIIAPTNKNSEQRDLWQDNKLINADSDYYYEYCQGGKTGFTDEAGGTLVSWAQKDNMQLICVTLNGVPSSENYLITKELFEYIFDNYSYLTPLKEFQFSAEELTGAQNYLNDYYNCENAGTMKLSVDTGKKIAIPNDIDLNKLDIKLELSSDRLASSIIGNLTVGFGDKTYIELPVTYSGYINSNDEEAVKEAIRNGTIRSKESNKSNSILKILIAILLIGIVSIIYLRIKYIKKQREAYMRRKRERAKNKDGIYRK